MTETATLDGKKGFEARLTNLVAECDGGGAIEGTRYAGRQDFRGRLTGDYVDVGDPPSRWFLMTDLEEKPANFEADAVWCLGGNTFLGEEGPSLSRALDLLPPVEDESP